MKDIAFHITDLVENSIHAGAHRIEITLNLVGRVLIISVLDDGCGMPIEALHRMRDPFFTTSGLRHRTGFGLPFLFQSTGQCRGEVTVESQPGVGTLVRARFPLDHIDSPPMGDLCETLMQAMVCNPSAKFTLKLLCDSHTALIDAPKIARILDGIPKGTPRIAAIVGDVIASRMREVFGEALIPKR